MLLHDVAVEERITPPRRKLHSCSDVELRATQLGDLHNNNNHTLNSIILVKYLVI